MSDSTEGTIDHPGGASWNKEKPMDQARRNLIIGTCVAGGAAAAAVAWPFLDSWSPSERAKALGAPVEADFSKLEVGQQMTVAWRGKPVWIIRRSKEMLADLSKVTPFLVDPDSKVDHQPPYLQK